MSLGVHEPWMRLDFESGGLRCAASLFRPTDMPGVRDPCVVMAHGFTGTRDQLTCYAETFARAGLAALTFDYRHFGGSEGSPRQIVDIGKQMEDWRSAIAMARTLDGVDSTRIALWGSSLSGGHHQSGRRGPDACGGRRAGSGDRQERARNLSRGKGEDDARRDLGRLTDRSVAPLPRRGNLRRGPRAGRPLPSSTPRRRRSPPGSPRSKMILASSCSSATSGRSL